LPYLPMVSTAAAQPVNTGTAGGCCCCCADKRPPGPTVSLALSAGWTAQVCTADCPPHDYRCMFCAVKPLQASAQFMVAAQPAYAFLSGEHGSICSADGMWYAPTADKREVVMGCPHGRYSRRRSGRAAAKTAAR
jgi:hypothetical protein